MVKTINNIKSKGFLENGKRRNRPERSCVVCGRSFIPWTKYHKYCSDKCVLVGTNRKLVSYYKKCTNCKQWFIARDYRHQYCSDKCSKEIRNYDSRLINKISRREYYLEKYDFVCQRCKDRFNHTDLHCHRIVPMALGGEDDESNIVVLCKDCHQIQHSVTIWKKIKHTPKSTRLLVAKQLLMIKSKESLLINTQESVTK